jgi:hypothetical protein
MGEHARRPRTPDEHLFAALMGHVTRHADVSELLASLRGLGDWRETVRAVLLDLHQGRSEP